MAVRIPTYERHVQLDSGAQTIPRIHGGGEVGAALSRVGDSLITLGAHYQKKQEQFDNMQLNQRMLRAKQDADAAYLEEVQNYDAHRDTPGTLHNKIMARVQAIYKSVYEQTPQSLRPKAQESIGTIANSYSHGAANAENDKIRGAATGDLDKIAAAWKETVKNDPTQAPAAITAMRNAVNGYRGSFSDGQRAVASKGYEDGIAQQAIEGYKAQKNYDAAKDFATTYAADREKIYGSGRLPTPAPAGQVAPETQPAPTGKRSEAAPAEGGAAFLAEQRAPMVQELENNPRLKVRLAALATLEHESDTTAVVESLYNRTASINEYRASRGQPPLSLSDMIYGKGGKSFYGPIRAGLLEGRVRELERNPARLDRVMGAIDRAETSNLLKGATDQGSGNDPNVNHPGGRIVRGGEVYNDWGGGGGHDANRRFRERQQAAISDAEAGKTAAPAQARTAEVVDTEGNKIVVDPQTGRMVKQADVGTKAAVDPTKYDTKLTADEEKKFQDWKTKNAPGDSGQDYDLRGAFKAGVQPDPETGHWPDTFKKPNHPTFSDQSQYAQDRPDLAGRWDGETFIPPQQRVASAGPVIGGVATDAGGGGAGEQVVVPLPRPRPQVPQTDSNAWLTSQIQAIDASRMKAQSAKSAYDKRLNETLTADIQSRRDTGVPVKLTPDLQKFYGTDQLSYEFVANHLGEGKAIAWEQEKEQADRDGGSVAHLAELPKSDIQDRIDSLKPVAGSPDYPKQVKTYEHAQKVQADILKLRDSDPAKAVESLPDVKNAKDAYAKDPSPQNMQILTNARMKAQDYLEVDDSVKTPLTNQEASRIAKVFTNKGILDPAGGAQAAIQKLKEAVGGNEDALNRGLSTILKQKNINETAQVLMSTELSRIQKQPAASISPSNAPTTPQKTAPKSMFPTSQLAPLGYDDYGRPIQPSLTPAEGGPPDEYADRDTGTFKYGQEEVVPADRVKQLMKNPAAEAAGFDREFGPGASASFVQKQQELSREGPGGTGLLPPVTDPWADKGLPSPVSAEEDPDIYKPPKDEEDNTPGGF
jgi:hypothetical protein